MPPRPDDIAEIVNLSHGYFLAADRRDREMWIATFAEDGELRSPLGNPNGRNELLDWFAGLGPPVPGLRHCSSSEVVDGNGDGDGGGGMVTMESIYLVIDTTHRPPVLLASGSYVDELVRVDGRWRFARRTQTIDPDPSR
jgi:hypothetical protein